MLNFASLSTNVPLIDIQSRDFAKQYELGVWWSMYGDEQGRGPVAASYLVNNLKCYAERDYFGTNDPFICTSSVSFSACTTVVSSRHTQAGFAPM